MWEEVEKLKRQCPLLEYLRRHGWMGRQATTARPEFVGLCPLHRETRPSFYVNAAKNLSIATAAGGVVI
jgi:DNA primase